MFGQVLDKVDSWLGRSFLLARYFPWLLFAIANLLAAAIEFPVVRTFLSDEYAGLGAGGKVVDLVIFLTLVGVVAFTVSPAVQPVRRMLEGRDLPSFIAEPLVLGQVVRRDRLSRSRDDLFRTRALLPKTAAVIAQLARARNRGEAAQDVPNPGSIEDAARLIELLRDVRLLNRPIPAADLQSAVDALAHALRNNCAEPTLLRPGAPDETKGWSRRLGRLHDEMVDKLAPYAIDIAQSREATAFDRQGKMYNSSELTATQFGNEAAALRSYSSSRYGFDFDLFWPRLQTVIKNDRLSNKLISAEIQVDFSILCLVLSVVYIAAWLIVTVWLMVFDPFGGGSFRFFAAIVIVGPPIVWLWSWMVRESFSGYAELIRTAIDISRFDLIDALQVSRPDNLADELALWGKLEQLLALDNHDNPISFTRLKP
jgi:hypothetical protein